MQLWQCSLFGGRTSYAEEKRDTFVELPDNVPAQFRATHVGKLRKALYGTRPAAASFGDELRKRLVSCTLTVGTVSRCCFRNESGSVAGTAHGDDIFVAGPRQDIAKMGATFKKRWETRDRMVGARPHDQKELHILNRTLRWCKDGLVFAANLRHGREVVHELGFGRPKPASSPATVDGVTRCQGDELEPLDGEGKRLYQRIVAKLNFLAHDRLDLKYATSCLACAVSSPSFADVQAAKRVGRYLRKAFVAWQGFLFHDSRPGELSCATWMPTGLRTRLLEGRRAGRRDSWWRSPQLLDKEARECCTVKLGKRAVRGHHVGHEILGDPERVGGS